MKELSSIWALCKADLVAHTKRELVPKIQGSRTTQEAGNSRKVLLRRVIVTSFANLLVPVASYGSVLPVRESRSRLKWQQMLAG